MPFAIAFLCEGVLAGVLVGGVMSALCIYGLRTYGAALFFATPVAIGAVSAIVANRPHPRTLRATIRVSVIAVSAAGVALLLFAIEGVICLLMALPIGLVIGVFGSALAWAILRYGRSRMSTAVACFFVGVPGFAGAEAGLVQPSLREVRTVIEVDAPPATVWRNVVSFSELPPPPEYVFRLGVAYPVRERIEGEGVGAVRFCEFSTGPFVEPITRWEPPMRLSFDVRSQPPSMKELSPYRHVNAPHQ